MNGLARWLLLLLSATLATAAPRAGLWREPGLEPVSDLAMLEATLQAAGYTVSSLSTADLLEPATLSPAQIELLVLPYGPAYPAAGRAALEEFLAGQGSYLALGGPSFTRPLYAVDGGFAPWDAFGETTGRVTTSSDPSCGPNDHLTVTATDPDGWRVAIDDLRGWAYAAFELPSLTDQDAGLCFEARAPEATSLALELIEADGSRWKQVVTLGPEWQTYRLHTGTFASYASPTRHGAADHFRPADGRRLLFGFTRGLAGGGAHELELRAIEFRRATVPASAVPAGQVPPEVNALARRWFPNETDGFRRTLWPTCFGTAESTSAGWTVTGPTAAAVRAGLFPGQGTATWRLIHPGGDPTRGLVMHYAGRFAGSAWAAVGQPHLDADGLAQLAPLLAALRESPTVSPLTVAPAEGQTSLAVSATLVGRSPTPETARYELREATGELLGAWSPTLARGESVTLSAPLPERAVTAPLTLQLQRAPTPLAEPPSATLDLTASLRALADYFVACGADDGLFSGVSFIDNRGARTLLGAWRIFGDTRYRDAALAWGDAMIAAQREDGGYRMGYGITSKGEACYVADGGEIAVAIASLAEATEGAVRARFLASLDTYMGYREDFRVPSGGIGVGWSLADFGQRPTVSLAVPMRIFAPEMNIYTISCTLAAAVAHAALHPEDPALMARCDADADWYLARAKGLWGAACESFLFAHALAPTPERRSLYQTALADRALAPMTEQPRAWWLLGGGRSAFNVEALAYWRSQVGPDPAVENEFRRALWAIYGQDSPTSIHRLIGRSELHQEDWIYLCYSGLGLADAIEPMVTMTGFIR